MSESGIGLREIKKQMTRESIADAALQLALEKGLDHLTIDEIARVAFVSPRTISNYFPSKEEAVVASQFPNTSTVIEQFAARPADEAPLPALAAILVDFVRSLPADQLEINLRKIRLGREYPALSPYLTGMYNSFEHDLRQCIADRSGVDVGVDLYPSLVASTAVSAVRSAIRMWAASGEDDVDLADLIQQAFDQIEAGLPAPAAETSETGPA